MAKSYAAKQNKTKTYAAPVAQTFPKKVKTAPGISAGKKQWPKRNPKAGTGTYPGISGGSQPRGAQKTTAGSKVKGARPQYRNAVA